MTTTQERRAEVDKPTPRQPCPTPGKRGWPTRGAALASFRTHADDYRPHRTYLCKCSRWHITSHGRWEQP